MPPADHFFLGGHFSEIFFKHWACHYEVTGIGQRSPEVGQRSPEVGQRSPEVGQGSPEVGQRSL